MYLWLIPVTWEFVAIMAYLALRGWANCYWGQVGGGLIILYLILSWCHADAEERAFSWPRGMSLMIVAVALIGVPIYLFRSRGLKAWKSLGWRCLYVLGIFLMLILTGSILMP